MERKRRSESMRERKGYLGCTKHRSMHLPGSEMSRKSDTFKIFKCSEVKLCCIRHKLPELSLKMRLLLLCQQAVK